MFAVEHGHEKVVNLLLCCPNIQVNAVNKVSNIKTSASFCLFTDLPVVHLTTTAQQLRTVHGLY